MPKTADGPHDFRLGVEFPPGLSLGHVETVRVELEPTELVDRALDLGRRLLPEPLPVRLIVPGAIVMPTEQTIDPSPFEATEVFFHVTPLVGGDLPQARVEMLRGHKVEMIQMPVHGQSHTLPRVLAILAILVPLLLHLPTYYADEIVGGSVERQVRAWLPGLGFRDGAAELAQSVAGVLATDGRAGHFSFFAFVGLATAALCVALLRHSPRQLLWSNPFTLTVLPASMGPPSYLTPVSTTDIGAVAR
jgi:hypothetical protein